MTIDQLIITRFNVRASFARGQDRLDPLWLANRFELFERYCLPSVLSQSNRAFRWLILLDAQTPSLFVRRIEAHSRRTRGMEPVYLEDYSAEVVRQLVHVRQHSGATHLITTRLDSDDSIAVDFVATVHRNAGVYSPQVINFPNGLTLADGRVYQVHDQSNPFASLIEPVGDACAPPVTIHGAAHTQLRKLAPVRQISASPMWLQVVHGGKVSNRRRGIRVSARVLRKRFAPDISADAELTLEVLYDRARMTAANNLRAAKKTGGTLLSRLSLRRR